MVVMSMSMSMSMSMTMTVLCTMMFTATPLSFNFPSFDPNGGQLNLTGNASIYGGGIQLTTSQVNTEMSSSIGRAVYPQLLRLHDKATGKATDFTTHFTFVIGFVGGDRDIYGDGMTFFLAHPHLRLSPSSTGAGLGLADGNNTPFVALEFDTYQTTQFGDPWYDHVGININSMNSTNYTRWENNIKQGITNDAWVTYNSDSMILRVVFTEFNNATKQTFLGDLEYRVDVRSVLPESVIFGFSAATGISTETHTLKSWNFSSDLVVADAPPPQLEPLAPTSVDPEPPTPTTNNKLGVAVGVSVAVVVACGVGLICYFCLRRRRARDQEFEDQGFEDMGMDEEFRMGTGPKKFSYDELVRSTKGFAEEEKLGEGGFGGVYRGFLREMNCYVAVKSVSKGSKQGVKEYASEVRIISRLRHKNLVQLIGWCHERRGLLLVYEFMSNGSLDFHLFKQKSMLLWSQRYKIVQDLASALFYLHEEWEQCVVHRDIKSSNIMLDDHFNAKLGDFGLARLVDHAKGSHSTVLAGTLGYMAPECSTTGKASKESDVFSFGVVMLEAASGRRPFNPNAEASERVLVQWVWDLYGRGKLVEAADPKLGEDYEEEEMKRLMIVGLWCAHPDYSTRPSVRQASQVLSGEAPLPILPSKMPTPTYLSDNNIASMSIMSYSESDGGQTTTSSSKNTTSSSTSSTTSLLVSYRNDFAAADEHI